MPGGRACSTRRRGPARCTATSPRRPAGRATTPSTSSTSTWTWSAAARPPRWSCATRTSSRSTGSASATRTRSSPRPARRRGTCWWRWATARSRSRPRTGSGCQRSFSVRRRDGMGELCVMLHPGAGLVCHSKSTQLSVTPESCVGGAAMTDDMSALLSGAVGVAAAGGVAVAGAGIVRRRRAWLPGGHALTGGDDRDPLRAAVRYGFGGATIAVRPGPRDELFVGTGEPRPGRTVRRMVLRPLAALVANRGGRLHPRQRRPFELVLEFTGPERDPAVLLRAYLGLERQLRDHAAVFSRVARGRVTPAPVTVLIAGTVDAREVLAGQDLRYAFADGTLDDVGSSAAPASLVPSLGEPW